MGSALGGVGTEAEEGGIIDSLSRRQAQNYATLARPHATDNAIAPGVWADGRRCGRMARRSAPSSQEETVPMAHDVALVDLIVALQDGDRIVLQRDAADQLFAARTEFAAGSR